MRRSRAFGRIDVLVNNAVFFNKKGVIDMTFEEWNRQTAVILGGAFLFTKHACQAMIDGGNGGSVINIVSTAGHQGEPSNIAYCDRQVRPAELHAVGRHGAGRPRHPRQQPDADRDRSRPSPSNAPNAGAAR